MFSSPTVDVCGPIAATRENVKAKAATNTERSLTTLGPARYSAIAQITFVGRVYSKGKSPGAAFSSFLAIFIAKNL
jgi:hypothetical protein